MNQFCFSNLPYNLNWITCHLQQPEFRSTAPLSCRDSYSCQRVRINNESNPWLQPLVFFPLFLLGWLRSLIPSLLGPLRHTHTHAHTQTPKLSHAASYSVSVVQHGAAAVVCLQLTWSSLDGEPVAFHHPPALTGDTSSLVTMEPGRVWSRYQRTVLLTMMMFKLGTWLFQLFITSDSGLKM